ncbi:S8 family serine peptidase [Geitlerinema sp. CS-897]|nr:S8 family serine peptidase [Geitlerinema sp. CS-897]
MRVLIQMRHNPEIAEASMGMNMVPYYLPISSEGFSFDANYMPVQLPDKQPREAVGAMEVGRLYRFDTQPEVSTYLVRGEVESEDALARLMDAVERDDDGVGVFADPQIEPIIVCGGSPPVGNDQTVENLLKVLQLHAKGMDGSNVMVAIVDTGINLAHLKSKGKTPKLDASKSWAPNPSVTPGNARVGHGTMCAFDVCIAAPNCTLLDYALLQSTRSGGSKMDGFLSDAIRAFSQLRDLLSAAPEPKPALVVNNSWGMYHPSWDFPVGHPGNYSDNPHHPFNITVESLEDAGADILFAAGNCGADCPDPRCKGVTNRPIYGANSHSSVLCIAGIDINKSRVGYSSQGPGRLDSKKPDLCAYTHFSGSEAFGAGSPDSGTSAACPVAAGVVAAIRSFKSPTDLPPTQLRELLRRTTEDLGATGFDYNHGYGAIDVASILGALDRLDIQELPIGGKLSGRLNKTNDSTLFRISVDKPIILKLDGPSGVDFDVYLRREAKPTPREFDYRGYTSSADEEVHLTAVDPGEYLILVDSYRGAGEFTLQAGVL